MSAFQVTIDGLEFEIELRLTSKGTETLTAVVNGEQIPIEVPNINGPASLLEWIIINDRPYEIAFDDSLSWVRAYSGLHQISVRDTAETVRPRSGDGRVKAPIPGLITRILVEEGQQVTADQPLVVLEAMKMENEIRAPFDGVVRSIPVEAGQSVLRRDVVVEIA